MFKSQSILIVEIGSSNVSGAVFEDRGIGSPLLVTKTAEVSIGVSGTYGAALQFLVKKMGVAGSKTVVLCPSQCTFQRFVNLPSLSNDKMGMIIQYEAEQNVPFPIDDVGWNYRMVGGEINCQQKVLIVAMRSSKAMEFLNAASAAGLKPKALFASSVSLLDYVATGLGVQCAMIIDSGAKDTTIMFSEGSRYFFRTVPFAGENITQKIMSNLLVDFDEAEALKKSDSMSSVAFEVNSASVALTPTMVARNILTRLYAEIKRIINYYCDQHNGSAPSRVLVCGGNSLLHGFREFFSKELAVPVEVVSTSELEFAKGVNPIGKIATLAGAAMEWFERCQPGVDLMPTRNKYKSQTRGLIQWLRLHSSTIIKSIILSVLLIAWVGAFIIVSYRKPSLGGVAQSTESSEGNRLWDESPSSFLEKALDVFSSVPDYVVVSSAKIVALPKTSSHSDVTLTASGFLKKNQSGSVDNGVIWVASATDGLSKMGMLVSMEVSVKDGDYLFSVTASR